MELSHKDGPMMHALRASSAVNEARKMAVIYYTDLPLECYNIWLILKELFCIFVMCECEKFPTRVWRIVVGHIYCSHKSRRLCFSADLSCHAFASHCIEGTRHAVNIDTNEVGHGHGLCVSWPVLLHRALQGPSTKSSNLGPNPVTFSVTRNDLSVWSFLGHGISH